MDGDSDGCLLIVFLMAFVFLTTISLILIGMIIAGFLN